MARTPLLRQLAALTRVLAQELGLALDNVPAAEAKGTEAPSMTTRTPR